MLSTTHEQKSVSICYHDYGWEDKDLASIGLSSLCQHLPPSQLENKSNMVPTQGQASEVFPEPQLVSVMALNTLFLGLYLLAFISTGSRGI